MFLFCGNNYVIYMFYVYCFYEIYIFFVLQEMYHCFYDFSIYIFFLTLFIVFFSNFVKVFLLHSLKHVSSLHHPTFIFIFFPIEQPFIDFLIKIQLNLCIFGFSFRLRKHYMLFNHFIVPKFFCLFAIMKTHFAIKVFCFQILCYST